MDFKESDSATLREWECPAYGRKIDEALCYEVANIGCDLTLPSADKSPCSNVEAHEHCKNCPHYAEWD